LNGIACGLNGVPPPAMMACVVALFRFATPVLWIFQVSKAMCQ